MQSTPAPCPPRPTTAREPRCAAPNGSSHLTDPAHVPGFMAGAGGALPTPPPATTMLLVHQLASPELLVEIEAVAAR